MREPTWTEVDGVPVAWLEMPGPLRALLSFRVGIANETAPMHGVTHLVEHLALYGMHERPYPLNGSVDLTRTTFTAGGRPEEVAEFLDTVCRRVGDLPTDRVEVERGILRAESSARSSSYREGLLFWRYGAQAHGLVGLAELGLHWLDPDTVCWWAAQRFTRQNAVLVLTGPPPPGLRLPLRDGPVQPPVVARPVEEVIPGWAAVSGAGLAMGATGPRTTALPAAVTTINHELTRVLRFERGITYSVVADYEPVDAGTAHATFSADAAEERHAELADAFVGVLEHLTDSGPPADAVARLRDMRERAEEEDVEISFLTSIGRDFAVGRAPDSFTELDARLRGITHDDLHEAIRTLASTAIYLLPEPLTLPPRYPQMPTSSWGTVTGDVHRGANGTLVVGEHGISAVHDGNAATVRWNDAVATLWWQDGARVVIGRDGFRVRVVPADWENGAAAVARIDQLVPPRTMVPMPGEGPRPAGPAPAEPPRGLVRPWIAWLGNGTLVLMGLSLLAAAADGPAPATADMPEVTRGDVVGMAVTGVVLLALSAWWTRTLLRRRRERR